MADGTEQLIDRLVADAKPVRRLRPPLWRAAAWLVPVAAIAAFAIAEFADLGLFAERTRDPKLTLELIGTLATGVVATIAAFYLSVPDRSPGWVLAPVPFLGLWIASSGYSCYRHWIAFGPDGWTLGESAECFKFIVLISVPLGATLLLLLRRAAPLAPVRVAAIGGLGVAGVAAFLLQFFHPFDVTVMDLAVHALAVGLVVGAGSLLGRFSDARQPL